MDHVLVQNSPDIARWTPRPEVWRLPRQTSDLIGDWRAVHRAHAASTEPWQERACIVRIQQLAERQHAMNVAALEPLRILAEQLGAALRGTAPVFERIAQALVPKTRRDDVAADRTPRGQLQLVRPEQLQHGPARAARPPRTIGRPRTAPR